MFVVLVAFAVRVTVSWSHNMYGVASLSKNMRYFHMSAPLPNQKLSTELSKSASSVVGKLTEVQSSTVAAVSKLNLSQRKAVTSSLSTGIIRCVAGPGSGKTSVLTTRVMFLLSLGEPAHSILSVTFTKKAAIEMTERLAKAIGHDKVAGVTMGTFHSICCRILRTYGSKYLSELTGFAEVSNDFSIYDQEDSLRIVKDILKQLKSDLKPNEVFSALTNMKEKIISSSGNVGRKSLAVNQRMAASIYEEYNRNLYTSNALDFGDLIIQTCRLLQRYPEVLSAVRSRYRHILVDEYQDTNASQNEFVRLLAQSLDTTDPPNASTGSGVDKKSTRTLFVAGDANQAIYSWRGAVAESMDKLQMTFPHIVTHQLMENYRCSRPIADVANSIIGGVVTVPASSSASSLSPAPPVMVKFTENDFSQANDVVRCIKHYKDAQVAVFVRTHAQTRSLEIALVHSRVKYRVVGNTRFFDRKEIKVLLGYLRFLANPRDAAAFQDVVNTPLRGIGEKNVERFLSWAIRDPAGVTDLSSASDPPPTLMSYLAVIDGDPDTNNLMATCPLTVREIKGMSAFAQLIKDLHAACTTQSLSNLIQTIVEKIDYKSYLAKLSKTTTECEDRMLNVEEMITGAKKYDLDPKETGTGAELLEALRTYLEEAVLTLQTTDDDDANASAPISLMTIHAAKGLEFDAVYVTGFEEGSIPMIRTDEQEVEEERRLAFVAVTRARRRLILLCRESTTMFGRFTKLKPSRFLKAMRTLPPASIVLK